MSGIVCRGDVSRSICVAEDVGELGSKRKARKSATFEKGSQLESWMLEKRLLKKGAVQGRRTCVRQRNNVDQYDNSGSSVTSENGSLLDGLLEKGFQGKDAVEGRLTLFGHVARIRAWMKCCKTLMLQSHSLLTMHAA